MRKALTIFGLALSLLAVSCGDKKRSTRVGEATTNPRADDASKAPERPAAKPGEPIAATAGSGASAPSAPRVCVENDAHDAATERWVAQLPAIIKFSITTKNGVLSARPACVRDEARTPNWSDVVEKIGFFGQDQLTVAYAPSVEEFVSNERFAKDERLILAREGRTWSGVRREVLRRPWLVESLLGPIEVELNIPSCTEAEMKTPVVLPRPLTCAQP